MKVKATTSFAGEICMAAGEVRDVPEDVAAPLLKCGYLEPVEAPAEPDQKPDEKPDETAEQEPEQETGETAEQEPEKPKRSRSKGAKTEG